jgi:hypothetical protein
MEVFQGKIPNSAKKTLLEAKKISAKIITAWKLEGQDLSKTTQILSQRLACELRISERKDIPSNEETIKALNKLMDIPKLAPMVALMLASPIPGSSMIYLSIANFLRKTSNGKVDLIPERFHKILDKDSET